jgi:hypothetical protein
MYMYLQRINQNMRKMSSMKISEDYGNCPKHDIKSLIGNMNAQIGREVICQPTTGNQGFHQETYDNGRKLVSFAAFRNMVGGRTMFEHKNVPKLT